MLRKRYTRSLENLRGNLMEMAHQVGLALDKTQEALMSRDIDLAKSVIVGDEQVNDMAQLIEQSCMYLITRQQPIATDLRVISSTMKVITDIERIGDQCSDICEIIERRSESWATRGEMPYERVEKMLEEAKSMYRDAVDCLLNDDKEGIGAKGVIAQDDIVDKMFNEMVLEVSSRMREKPELAAEFVDNIMILKYIERIGDHATNIAEWAIYLYTGTHPGF